MQRTTMFTLIALAALVAAGAFGGYRVVATKGPAATALSGHDPVQLVAGRRVFGKPGITVEHGPFLYSFADVQSVLAFRKEPARYAIQGGGSCATMPDTDADPSIFTVHDGRIYAFASEACRESFLTDPDAFVTAGGPRD